MGHRVVPDVCLALAIIVVMLFILVPDAQANLAWRQGDIGEDGNVMVDLDEEENSTGVLDHPLDPTDVEAFFDGVM
jgi:hypothetical protein